MHFPGSSWSLARSLSSRKKWMWNWPAHNVGAGVDTDKPHWAAQNHSPCKPVELRFVFVSHWDLGIICYKEKSWTKQWSTEPVTELVSKIWPLAVWLQGHCLKMHCFLVASSSKNKIRRPFIWMVFNLFVQHINVFWELKMCPSSMKLKKRKKHIEVNKLLFLPPQK